MKKFFILVLAVLAITSCSKVPAGYVGVKYYLLGKDKGVDSEELGPGRYWIGVNEELYLFPTFRQNKTWTSDVREDSPVDEDFDFQSRTGLALTASVGIEYHIPAENVAEVFQKYKRGPDEITNKVLRNAVREAFNIASSTRTAEEMYGEGKVDFLNEVDKIAREYAVERGIVIDDIFLVGNIGIPRSVEEALNNKIQATQKAQQRENELRQTIAEARKVVEKARGDSLASVIQAAGQAEANRRIAQSVTPNLIKYIQADRWNGILPQVSGQSTPFIDLRNK